MSNIEKEGEKLDIYFFLYIILLYLRWLVKEKELYYVCIDKRGCLVSFKGFVFE